MATFIQIRLTSQKVEGELYRALRKFWQHNAKILFWYLFTLLGIIARAFFAAYAGHAFTDIPWDQVVFSVIVAAVIFPLIYEKVATIGETTPLMLQLFVTFQAGFFWQSIFLTLTKQY